MQVWNVLHVARWKYRTQKWCKKSPSAHHRTTLSGYIFATKAHIDNRKKLVKQQYLFLQYGELRPTSGWDRFVSLGHPNKFQRVSRLCSVTAQSNCGVEQRAPPVFGRAAIRLGIGPHSSLICCCMRVKHSGDNVSVPLPHTQSRNVPGQGDTNGFRPIPPKLPKLDWCKIGG